MGGLGDRKEAGIGTTTYTTILQEPLGLSPTAGLALSDFRSGALSLGRLGCIGPHCVLFMDRILHLGPLLYLQMEKSREHTLVCYRQTHFHRIGPRIPKPEASRRLLTLALRPANQLSKAQPGCPMLEEVCRAKMSWRRKNKITTPP